MNTTVSSISGDNEKKELILILETDYIQSVNNLYQARVAYTKAREAYPVIYKSPDVVSYIKEITDQLESVDFKSNYPWIYESKYFDITAQFVMNKQFGRRDLSNCQKIIEDILFGGTLGLNDSRVLTWRTWKSFLPESDKELIMIKLSESNFDFMFKSGV